MLITNEDILNTIGNKIKQARLLKGYTQEFLAENVDVSTDLIRNIENGRNVGSVATLLNLYNFLEISPNFLFSELLTYREPTLDTTLISYFSGLSDESKNLLKEIIIHIDKNY